MTGSILLLFDFVWSAFWAALILYIYTFFLSVSVYLPFSYLYMLPRRCSSVLAAAERPSWPSISATGVRLVLKRYPEGLLLLDGKVRLLLLFSHLSLCSSTPPRASRCFSLALPLFCLWHLPSPALRTVGLVLASDQLVSTDPSDVSLFISSSL